jgi:hypothetical protein
MPVCVVDLSFSLAHPSSLSSRSQKGLKKKAKPRSQEMHKLDKYASTG